MEELQRRIDRWFQSALVYREWKENRMWFAIACGLMGVVPLATLLVLILGVLTGSASQFGTSSQDFVRTHMQDWLLFRQGETSPLIILEVFVVCGLAAVQVCSERTNGSLLYTLTGPVNRRDYLRVKYAMGVTVIFGLFWFLGFVYTVVDVFGGLTIGEDILRWFICQVMVLTAVYSATFMASILVGNLVVAAIAGLGISAFPWIVELLFHLTVDPAGEDVMFAQMSPLYDAFLPNLSPAFALIWFGLWNLGLVYVSQKLFQQLRTEQFSHFFTFPVLWKWTLLVVSAVVSLLVVGKSTNQPNRGNVVLFVVLTLILWVAAQFVVRLYARLSRSIGR